MRQRFLERLVAVLVLHILADDGDVNVILGVVAAIHQVFPRSNVGLRSLLVQVLQDQRVQSLVGKA